MSTPEIDSGTQTIRLSDRILYALDLALDQEDIEISDMLTRSLEQSMTRGTGGPDFVERREYPQAVADALERLEKLKKRNA